MAETEAYELFDANGVVLGRLASAAAKALYSNKRVVVINAEHAIISGNRKNILKHYKARMDLKDKANPEHSPYWPRRPDLLVKRIIRGMLPYKDPSGRAAYHRLRVFIGVPTEYNAAKRTPLAKKDLSALYVRHITVKDLSKTLGYNRP